VSGCGKVLACSQPPLDTHYNIASYAIERGIHVLVTKPAVQILDHHKALIAAAEKHNVICFVELHKRFVGLLH